MSVFQRQLVVIVLLAGLAGFAGVWLARAALKSTRRRGRRYAWQSTN